MYKSVRQAMSSRPYIASVLFNIFINFVLNYGLQRGTLTNWGSVDMYDLSVFQVTHIPNTSTYTSLAFDALGSSFLVAFFTSLLGPRGAINDVKTGKLQKLDVEAISTGIWRFLPVRSKSIWARSFALGFLFMATFGPLTTLGWWLTLGSSTLSGYTYCWFKALWCPVLAVIACTIAHMSATASDKWPAEQEHKE